MAEKSKNWAKTLLKNWNNTPWTRTTRQEVILRKGISLLNQHRPAQSSEVQGQPFDAHLVSLSSLYRQSREIFLKNRGKHVPALVSTPRTLSSPILLENTIEYSPIESELIWAATDRFEKKNSQHLMTLRSYVSNLFHEQNHRILWTWVPPTYPNSDDLRRYLNFIESMVVTLDLALGDELGGDLAALFHLCGVAYDPGSDILEYLKTKREYRNYLHAALYSTYLNLENFHLSDIPLMIQELFPSLGDLAQDVAHRANQLDRKFVEKTNPVWQNRHRKITLQRLTRRSGERVRLSEDPMNNVTAYLLAEKWFEMMGL